MENPMAKIAMDRLGRREYFFAMISSYANTDILTASYFYSLLNTLDFEEYKTAVITMQKSLARNELFYAKLDERHFCSDG